MVHPRSPSVWHPQMDIRGVESSRGPDDDLIVARVVETEIQLGSTLRGNQKISEQGVEDRADCADGHNECCPRVDGRAEDGLMIWSASTMCLRVSYECFHVTEKFVPLERLDVVAFVTRFATMSIRSGLNEPMAWPFTRADEKLAVPKFVSGSTPPDPDGASATASADASRARLRVCVVWYDPPVVLLCNVRVKRPFPCAVTDPLIASPALIASDRVTGNFGYISYQA